MYLFIGIALMVVALIGIIWCQKKQKVNPNAQAFAFVFLVLILIGAGTVLWDQGIFGGEDREMNRIIENETAYAAARSEILAKYLVGKYPGKKARIAARIIRQCHAAAVADIAGVYEVRKSLCDYGNALLVDLRIEQGPPAVGSEKYLHTILLFILRPRRARHRQTIE